jgi:glutaredoxin
MTLTLYSTTTCAPCKIVARKFTAAGIRFEKIDLDQPEHADTLANLKASLGTDTIHTPTIIDNGVVAMVGMNPAQLNDLIAKHRRDGAA